MKLKQIAGIFFVIQFVFVTLGCLAPAPAPEPAPAPAPVPVTVYRDREVVDTRMPLTIAIIQRLRDIRDDTSNDVIDSFQLHLFSRITLEREYIQPNDGRDPDGRARFENVHVKEVITINDQTEGQVIRVENRSGGEILLYVSFDDIDDFLVFSSRTINPDGFFNLVYEPSTMISINGDEKGWVNYGGFRYRVRYVGERSPYLLIKLSQSNIDRINSRTLGGRRIQ
ncbi:MAG: hypothetical protein FWD40_07510 [Treponema sp.]|nr:hypothetical protein [Treponema sp.]